MDYQEHEVTPAVSQPGFHLSEQIPCQRQRFALIVDDEDSIRRLGRRMMETMGYGVLTAKDGLEGVEVYRQRRDDIDVVVLDVKMPNLGGGDALRRMREIRPDLAAILTSGYDADSTASEFTADRRCAFLKKPYRLSTLQEAVRELAEQRAG